MNSSFVISLDFELMWGVRDKRTVNSYGDNILGGRKAIPEILKLFAKNGIHATWATVGLLFARNRKEMLDYMPGVLPNYVNTALSPYNAIRNHIGDNEKQDPWHYGHSLINMIRDTPGQELATHTYSHYYCLEDGQSLGAFKEDLESAKAIALNTEIDIKSIVFPRNQMTIEHIDCCHQLGISCYRGNTETFSYRSRKDKEIGIVTKTIRFIDSVVPIEGHHGYTINKSHTGIRNIPASRFLRPANTCSQNIVSKLQLARTKSEMTKAAISGEMYHLWCHPHNFGNNPSASLANLRLILQHFRVLHDQYGMESRNMASFG